MVFRSAGEILGQGQGIDLHAASSEALTSNEAADVIRISRPTLLTLGDEGVRAAVNVPGSSHRRLHRLEVETCRDSRLQLQAGLNTLPPLKPALQGSSLDFLGRPGRGGLHSGPPRHRPRRHARPAPHDVFDSCRGWRQRGPCDSWGCDTSSSRSMTSHRAGVSPAAPGKTSAPSKVSVAARGDQMFAVQ